MTRKSLKNYYDNILPQCRHINMATLSKQEVKNIAHLARLKLTDKEFDFYAVELSRVLNYVEELNKADIGDIKATAHVSGMNTIVRDDTAHSGSIEASGQMVQKLMASVRLKYKAFVKVKAILDKK